LDPSLTFTFIGAPNVAAAQGVLPIPIGIIWLKGLTVKGGPVQLRLYQELLKTLIESGKGKPSFVFDREFRIEDGAEAFREFSAHKLIKAVFRFDNPPGTSTTNGKRKRESSETPNRRVYHGRSRGRRVLH
jgi:threonine dehydrogenase-like Zn-dependent dehydrogenase